MKPEEIHITDWMRIMLGEVPWSFLLEAALRIALIYFIIIFSMRLMGKRMGSVLTRNEMIAMISLAAANGVAMQSPDRGMLPVIIIALVVVSFQWIISKWSMKSKRFEYLALDDINTLVSDGRLQLSKMKQTRLTRERLLAEFRSRGILNLGRVQRAYMEANGAFTILKYQEDKPGLSILPNWDHAFKEEQRKADGQFACASCGELVNARQEPQDKCERCGHREWEPAVIS